MNARPHTRALYARIWEVVMTIPPGRIASYGQVAEVAGLSGRARLVGRALSELPEDSTVPWHRVLNAAGRISFPVGSDHHALQRSLLESEGIRFENGRCSAPEWDPARD